jgi:TIR domain
MAAAAPKVLISYSHDSSDHEKRVLELANRLRAGGIDCTIDQYVVVPAEGWPRWMDKQIRDSDFVVMVCTDTYYERVMGEEQPGKGLGVRWEGHLIYQAIYNAESMNTKFIPVLFESGKYAHIPAPVQSTAFYFAQTEDGYEGSGANCFKCMFLSGEKDFADSKRTGQRPKCPERWLLFQLAV